MTKKRNTEEHNLQIHCIAWFDMNYPGYRQLLFSIPNGELRHPRVAVRLKQEGCRAGVADLFLSIPRSGKHGLYIEMKGADGKQSKEQKAFETSVIKEGYAYKLIDNYDVFISLVDRYMEGMYV